MARKSIESQPTSGEETQGEILEAIELTPKEEAYEDAKEKINKEYDERSSELETAKGEFGSEELRGYPYSQLESAIKRGDLPSRYGFRSETEKEVWEMIKNIIEEEGKNEARRSKALREILKTLTGSEKEESE